MTEPQICGAQHPNVESVHCELAPGPNAMTDPVYEMVELGTGSSVKLDEDGNPIILEPGHEVHVHKGVELDAEGTVICIHRWEDVPPED